MKKQLNTTLLVFIGATAGTLAQTLITFDEIPPNLQHGSFFSGSEYAAQGVTFTVDSNGPHDQLAIYDTDTMAGSDPDLELPFLGGNAETASPGNALIIAENITNNNSDNLIDSPDDEVKGGRISVHFTSSQINIVSFSLLDTPESITSNVSIVFEDSLGGSTTWSPSDLVAFDSTASFGNNFANNFTGIGAEDLGLNNIQTIHFNIESGALDNLSFGNFTQVPEPTSTCLIGLGISNLLLRRKR